MTRMSSSGALIFLTLAAAVSSAEPEPRGTDPQPYYKLLVPEKLLDEKPNIARGYSPYPRDDFWKLLDDAQGARGSATQALGPRVTRAAYRARWSREWGLRGEEAKLTITTDSDSSALLPLEPFGIAIGAAVWEEQPLRPALIGLSPQGQTAVMVDRSSVLTFPWALRGKQGTSEHAFELFLPTAPLQKLNLTLPSAWRPIVPGAIIAREDAKSTANSATWRIELGQQTPALLTLVNPQDPASQPLILLREASSANLSAAGLDFTSTFTLDIHHQPLNRLEITCPAGVEVSTVRVGDKSLPFLWLSGSADRQRLAIDLPDPLLGVLRVVTVQGLLPWTPGKPISLPRLSVEGAVWQEGAATLSLAPQLELTQLAISGGRQTGVIAPSGGSGESYQLQFFSPQASAEIHARPLAPSLRIESFGNLQLDPGHVSGVISSHLRAERGETFELQLDVSREWILDTLDTTPPDVIEERNFAQASDGGQTLHLRLKQAVREGQDLALVIRTRRRGAAVGEELGPEQFRFLRFQGNVHERRTLSVGAADSTYLIQTAGDAGLRRVPSAALPADVGLTGRMDEQLTFVDDESANSLRLKLQMEAPQFAAFMKVQATVDHDRLEEVYRLRLQPQNAAINEVLVRFGSPRRESGGWQFADSEEQVTAQRLEPPTDLANDLGETWRLRWKRARSESFELISRSRSGFGDAFQLNWLSAPAAASQTGVIEIAAENGELLAVDAPDLDAVPSSAPSPEQAAKARAAFRYDPSRQINVTIARKNRSSGESPLLIRSLFVKTRFQIDGEARHVATAKVENLGVNEITVHVPQASGPIVWSIDGRQISALPATDRGEGWRIPLPDDPRSTLEIEYSSPPQRIGWLGWRKWDLQLPTFAAPVLVAQWQAELPPGVIPVSERWLPSDLTEIGERLFGPLWGTSGYSYLGRQGSSLRWTTLRGGFAENAPSVSICHAQTCDAWGWASLIVIASLGLVVRLQRRLIMLLCAGLFAVLTLVLPEPYVPWASGALAGALIAGIAQATAWRIDSEPAAGIRAIPVSSGAITTAILLLPCLEYGLGLAAAQQGQAAAGGRANGRAARRIIVPTNEMGEESSYVYVEPEFHEQLQRAASTPLSNAVAWLARSADYQLQFQSESDGQRRLESLTAHFQLELLAGEAVFRLPLPRNKVHLLPDGVRVDRTSVAADWTEDDKDLRIPLRGAGSHTIEIKLRPVLQRDNDYERLDLEIPPIAAAHLTIAGAAPGDLELLQSAEPLSPGSNSENLVARLGPTPQLRLRWLAASVDGAVTTTEGNQLVWWKIRPGGVTAEARFRVRPLSGRLRELKFKLDPRMRVVAWDCDHEIAAQRQVPDDEQWRLTLKRPTEKEVMVRAQFLLTGTTGIGNLVLPQTDVVADRVAQAFIGFSTATGLALDLDAVSEQNRVSPADFLTNWAGADAAPEQAFRVVGEGGSRSVVIRPEMGKIRYQSSYAGSMGPDQLSFRWEATLLETLSDSFELSFTAPSQARIVRVELTHSGMPVALRFYEQSSGKVLVRLAQPVELGSTLAVQFNMPWPESKSEALPEVILNGGMEESTEWRVYRAATVLAELAVAKGWSVVEGQTPGSWTEGQGRLVGIWRRNLAATSSPMTCRVVPNKVQVVGRLITMVHRLPGGWQAEVRGDVEVKNGQLDQIRLDVPAEWSGPLEATPAQQIALRESSHVGRRTVLLRPPLPISGAWRFSIRGPLTASMGEGVRAPDAQLLDLGEFERLLVLPTRLEQQRVEWQTSGLQATDLPEGMLTTDNSQGWEAFRAIASRFRAIVKQVERFSGEPVVHLAEHRVIREATGRYAGQSQFEIEPGGTGQVHLEVPAHLELIQVQVGSQPARLRGNAEGAWTVELNSDQWPQTVQALYRSRGERVFANVEAPRLAGLRVENTLWKLQTPKGQAVSAPIVAGNTTAARQSLVRLEGLMIVARAIVDIGLTGESPEGLVDGWVNWRGRWTRERNAVDSPAASAKDAFFEAKLASLDAEYEALLPRLPAGALAHEVLLEPNENDGDAFDAASLSTAYFAFTGAMPTIAAPASQSPARIRPEWWLSGAAAVCLLLGVLLYTRIAVNWLERWSYLAVGVAGALWLAFLQPSWFGFVLFAWAWGLAWRKWPGSQVLPFDFGKAPSLSRTDA